MYIDFLWLFQLVEWAIEVEGALSSLASLLSAYDDPDYSDLTYEQRVAILKRCTKIVVNLNLDVNCYPLGYETTLLFDRDGNPLP